MPLADYVSTARSLALPIDDPENQPPSSPAWRRRGSNSFVKPQRKSHGAVRQACEQARGYLEYMWALYMRLALWQRILAAIFVIAINVLLIVFLIKNEAFFAWIKPHAERWREVRFGWLVIWFLVLTVSFPPLIGYSMLVTISGFIYGALYGWLIVASATIIGSTLSFLASRTVLSNYVHRLMENDKKFAALSLTLKHDGLKLLCMIRLCPLPYSLSNGAISTIPSVHWTRFMLATAIASPKLLVHVWIGSKFHDLAREDLDMRTRIVSYVTMGLGMAVGAGTAWFIYQKTKARAKELEAQEAENAIEDRPQGHGRQYSDDPAEEAARNTSRRDDDISLHDQEHDAYEDFLEDDEFNDEDDPFEGRDNQNYRGRP